MTTDATDKLRVASVLEREKRDMDGEMAERTGVSIDTLRYYEREGLLTQVSRAPNGHRRYSGEDVGWIPELEATLTVLDGKTAVEKEAFAARDPR